MNCEVCHTCVELDPVLFTPKSHVCDARPSPDALARRALNVFGDRHQTVKAVEELGELVVALARWNARIPDPLKSADLAIAIIDEIADVTIMLDQLREVFGTWECDEQTNHKRKRLARLIDRAIAENPSRQFSAEW